MKKFAAIAAAAVLAMALGGCAAQSSSSASSSTTSMSASDVSASASASSASASTSASSAAAVKWTEVASGAEAAKGAGFDIFGVPSTIMIADINFANPKFAYADGVAQATYEDAATALIIRKADGNHTAALSDHNEGDFATTWTKTCEGFEVTCHGAARGSAVYVTWKNGTKEYGVTLQALGNEDAPMDSEDVDDLVKAMLQYDVAAAPVQQSQSAASASAASASASASAASTGYISEDEAKNAAIAYMGATSPDQVTTVLVTGGDAPHYLVTVTTSGNNQTVEIDAVTGAVWSESYSYNSPEAAGFISEDTAKTAAVSAANNGLPREVYANLVVGGDAPHYDVQLVYENETREVQVDAYSGQVW